MNRHERRAAAAQAKRRGAGKPSSRMLMSMNSPIPMDIKRDIAACVRAIEWDTAGQDCISRAFIGKWVLELLGFHGVDMTVGSLLYRAGYDPSRDVCAFHGPGNVGVIDPNGYFLGHVWLEMWGEIIDFTCGDWNSVTAADADVWETGFGEIEWVKPPPQFVWANKSLFDWQPIGAPKLGECWYGPFWGDFSPPVNDLAAQVISRADGHMRANLTRVNLFERCAFLHGQDGSGCRAIVHVDMNAEAACGELV